MKRVVLLIRSLDIGGAERQVVLLASALRKRGLEVLVLTFYEGGALQEDLLRAGVPVIALGKRGRWDMLPFFVRLVRVLRRYRPDILYSFLQVANILAIFVRPFVPGMLAIWGVRASNVDFSYYGWVSAWAAGIERLLARYADRIVANSEAGRAHHIAQGFPADSFVVIPNGIDTDRFRFDAIARERVRAQWRIDLNEFIIGIAARLDPMKGYETFLEAAGLLARRRSNVRFVCVGDGPAAYRSKLVGLVDAHGVADRVIWAGMRNDVPSVYSAFDIASSASGLGEGFSNSIAEAMSCERPCVVTDVGDSAFIVGDAGFVVPPRDAAALAQGWERMLYLDAGARDALGVAGRRRIEEIGSVQQLVEGTLKIFQT